MSRKGVVLRFGYLVILVSLISASWASSGLFQAPQTYRTESMYSLSLEVADVNGDGNFDLIVPDGCMNIDNCTGVGVLLGNGDGTFQPVRTYDSGGFYASSVAVADVNGDNKLDLLVANWDPMVGVLLGNGDGTFQPAQMYPTGGKYGDDWIAIGDFNGDGNPDLVVAHRYYFGLGVLLGNGDGTFQPAQTYSWGDAQAHSIIVADVDGDGKLDLLDALEDGNVGVLFGNGDGTFQPSRTYYSGGKHASSVALQDVNGDGKPDLLVSGCFAEGCGHGGLVSIMLSNGGGNFQPPQIYKCGEGRTYWIAVGDVNEDGNADLLVAHAGRWGIGMLLGSGDGTFQAAHSLDSASDGVNSIALADVNKDGKPDLLVAEWCGDRVCEHGGQLAVLWSRVSTTTALNSTLNPSIYGQKVTFTATVVASGGQNAPTGWVTFRNGSKSIGRVALTYGTATLTTRALPSGTLSITAKYHGDPASIESTSEPLNQVVNRATSMTTIKSSMNPSAQGQPVTFIAKVTSPTATVTGTVTFTADSTVLGIISLHQGRASLTTSALPTGNNTIKATYDGTANIIGSAASLTQIVN